MEIGFYHSDRGYWQAIDGVVEELLLTYPEGTIEVPIKPGAYYEWQEGAWVYLPPSPEEARSAMAPLTARQLRLGLVKNGYTLAQVQTAIDAISDEQAKAEAQIEWDYATSFLRLHPLVVSIGAALSLSEDDIDTMWTAALLL